MLPDTVKEVRVERTASFGSRIKGNGVCILTLSLRVPSLNREIIGQIKHGKVVVWINLDAAPEMMFSLGKIAAFVT